MWINGTSVATAKNEILRYSTWTHQVSWKVNSNLQSRSFPFHAPRLSPPHTHILPALLSCHLFVHLVEIALCGAFPFSGRYSSHLARSRSPPAGPGSLPEDHLGTGRRGVLADVIYGTLKGAGGEEGGKRARDGGRPQRGEFSQGSGFGT